MWCSAVTVAEVSRGKARSARVAAPLSRGTTDRRLRVQVTDVPFARVVGTVLEAASAGSEDIADAHVVALCVGTEQALVVTSDPDDIRRLADTLPGSASSCTTSDDDPASTVLAATVSRR